MSLTPPSTPPFSPTTIPPRPALSPIPATPPTSPPDPLTADSQYDWMAGGWEAHDGPDGRFWIDKERYRVSESFIHPLVVRPLTKSLMLRTLLSATRHPKDVLIPSLPREVWNDVVVLYTYVQSAAFQRRLFAELTGTSTSWRLPTETLARCIFLSRVREAS